MYPADLDTPMRVIYDEYVAIEAEKKLVCHRYFVEATCDFKARTSSATVVTHAKIAAK